MEAVLTLSLKKLRPPCVRLNKVTLELRTASLSTHSELDKSLSDVLAVLNRIVQSPLRPHLDAKLAEYIFFPLSNVFKERRKLSNRSLELAVQCLSRLLQTGWRSSIGGDLGVQLLILLTFIAGGEPGSRRGAAVTDELQEDTFLCIGSVLSSVGYSQASQSKLLNVSNIPALGHTVTTLLDGIERASSAKAAINAVQALGAFVNLVQSREILASFLPGIASCLSKVLMPSTRSRRSHTYLEACIKVLTDLLTRVLANEHVKPSEKSGVTHEEANRSQLIPRLDASWLRATTLQLKMALANVMRLRIHDHLSVKLALAEMCLELLASCRVALEASVQMLLETCIVLANGNRAIYDRIYLLASENTDIETHISIALHAWLISLPRVLSSNDDSGKQRIGFQIETCLTLLSNSLMDASIVSDTLLDALKSSAHDLFAVPQTFQTTRASAASISSTPTIGSASQTSVTTSRFDPIIKGRGNENVQGSDSLLALIKAVASKPFSLSFARSLLDEAQNDNRAIQTSNFWLCLQIMRTRIESRNELLEVVDVESSDQDNVICDHLYSVSLDVLLILENGEKTDERLAALALESIVLYSQAIGHEFNYELIDALYPVLHCLGATSVFLRDHAVTALNLLANYCGDGDAQGLVESNADHIINSISRKMNILDFSPQVSTVLKMLIRLCGQSIIPYLSDLTESMFEALESFHYYQEPVEDMFSVFAVLVDEGVKANVFELPAGQESTKSRVANRPLPIETKVLIASLTKVKSQSNKDIEIEELDLPEPTPRHLWKNLKSSSRQEANETQSAFNNDSEENMLKSLEPELSTAIDLDANPALTAQYKTVQKIASLTQHHLSSSSPSVRHLLLLLLQRATNYLALHEDSFLPLIHSLWPAIIPRLRDQHVYVVASALDMLGALCQEAGDFVLERIVKIWPEIRRIIRLAKIGNAQHDRGNEGISVIVESLKQSPKTNQNGIEILTGASEPNETVTGSQASTIGLQLNKNLGDKSLTPTVTPFADVPPPSSFTYDSSSNAYVSTTTKMLEAALRRFAAAYVASVSFIPYWILEDVIQDILGDDVLKVDFTADKAIERAGRNSNDLVAASEKSPDVLTELYEALARYNADALWLSRSRAQWRVEMQQKAKRVASKEKHPKSSQRSNNQDVALVKKPMLSSGLSAKNGLEDYGSQNPRTINFVSWLDSRRLVREEPHN